MAEYELIFEIGSPTDAQVDHLYGQADAIVARHGRTSLVTITSAGPSALTGARATVALLESIGMTICRLYEDLVTRSEIADRSGVTPQAVGLWIRGERHGESANPFPEPYNYVGGSTPVWLWGEVNLWLGQVGKADGLRHPARVDYVLINEWLLARSTAITQHTMGTIEIPVSVSEGRVQASSSAANPWRALILTGPREHT
jgi:hypothetical protein